MSSAFAGRFAGLQHEQELARANSELVSRFEATGHGLVSSTRLDGRYAIRMCVMNHTTARADVERTVSWLANVPEGIVAGAVRLDRPVPATRPVGLAPAMAAS